MKKRGLLSNKNWWHRVPVGRGISSCLKEFSCPSSYPEQRITLNLPPPSGPAICCCLWSWWCISGPAAKRVRMISDTWWWAGHVGHLLGCGCGWTRDESIGNVPRLAPHHLALQHPRVKIGSYRKRRVGVGKKFRVIALILIKNTCDTS